MAESEQIKQGDENEERGEQVKEKKTEQEDGNSEEVSGVSNENRQEKSEKTQTEESIGNGAGNSEGKNDDTEKEMETNKIESGKEDNGPKDGKVDTNREEDTVGGKDKDPSVEWPCGKCGKDTKLDSVECGWCGIWFCTEDCSGLSDLAEIKRDAYVCTKCSEIGVIAQYSNGEITLIRRANKQNRRGRKGTKAEKEKEVKRRQRKRSLNEMNSPEKTINGRVTRSTGSPTGKKFKTDEYIKSQFIFSLVGHDEKKTKTKGRRKNGDGQTGDGKTKTKDGRKVDKKEDNTEKTDKKGEAEETKESKNKIEDEKRREEEEKMKEERKVEKKDENLGKKDDKQDKKHRNNITELKG